jgi:hypothetical protein
MAIEIRKPTTYTDYDTFYHPANCYDGSTGGDESTYGYTDIGSDYIPCTVFHTWQTKGETYTATTLKLKWQTSATGGDDEWGIDYTKNGGSNWYALVAMGVNRNTSWQTAQVSLDANQDLTQVQVRLNTNKIKGPDGINAHISDIWTEGEYTAGTPANAPVTTSALSVIPIAVAVVGSAVVSAVQSVVDAIPIALTVIGSVVVPITTSTVGVVPYDVSVDIGQSAPATTSTVDVVPYDVTVNGNANVSISHSVVDTVPYDVAVSVGGSANAPITQSVVDVVSADVAISCGVSANASQSVIEVIPYGVSVSTEGDAEAVITQLVIDVVPYDTGFQTDVLRILKLLLKKSKVLSIKPMPHTGGLTMRTRRIHDMVITSVLKGGG